MDLRAPDALWLFERAVEADRNSPTAWTGLAAARWRLVDTGA